MAVVGKRELARGILSEEVRAMLATWVAPWDIARATGYPTPTRLILKLRRMGDPELSDRLFGALSKREQAEYLAAKPK